MNHPRCRSGVLPFALLAGAVIAGAGCGRDLAVADSGSGGSVSPGAGGAGGGGLTEGIDQTRPGGTGGTSPPASPAGGSGGSSSGAAGGAGGVGGAGGTPTGTGGAGPGTGGAGTGSGGAGATGGTPAPAAAIQDLEVLIDGLGTIQLPAVGSSGVSLLQYASSGTAFVREVEWSRATRAWHESSAARFIYTAASGNRYLSLLYAGSSYGIYANGTAAEMSGTPASYKEFLAANDDGFAWVDYATTQGGGRPQPGGGPGNTPMGKIVFQSWAGARSAVTDALRYRARLDLSGTHVAYVEYASTAAGSIGQVMVQPLAGGAAIAVAPGSHHQDRPSIDGDWVVWEEYLDATSSVIRARQLSTGQVRDLSARTAFRTNPDVRGSRVIWEDQRSGNGDIYFTDVTGGGERVAVSGAGHSAAARLTDDGLVWIETNAGKVGLLRARWAP
jgi:beta propeller repeat protein